jgi:hypothetical protein
VTHGTTIAEARLDGMTVTIELTQTERLDDSHIFGPLARIDIVTCDGAGMELDLTVVQVKMLTRALTASGGAKLLAEALAAGQAALEEGPNGER